MAPSQAGCNNKQFRQESGVILKAQADMSASGLVCSLFPRNAVKTSFQNPQWG